MEPNFREMRKEIEAMREDMKSQKREVEEVKRENASLKTEVRDLRKEMEDVKSAVQSPPGVATYQPPGNHGKKEMESALYTHAGLSTPASSSISPNLMTGAVPASKLRENHDKRSKAIERENLTREELFKSSNFECKIKKPIVLVAPDKTFLNEYPKVSKASAFMDTVAGVYTTPIKGKYSFTLWVTHSGRGEWHWYLCSSGGVHRRLTRLENSWSHVDETMTCEKDEGVWIEVHVVSGNASVAASFSGGLRSIL